MNIDPIDDGNDLFAISNVFPYELLTRLHTKDLNEYKWEREDMQEDLLRCKLSYNDRDILKEFETFINKKDIIEQLSDTFSETFHDISCNFWLDKPGYTISNHPDNSRVKHVIQIFLWPNNINLGTTFYHNKFPTDDNINNLRLRKKLDYQVNTGYIMNNLYQIHGMNEPVPQDSIRFSLYGHIG